MELVWEFCRTGWTICFLWVIALHGPRRTIHSGNLELVSVCYFGGFRFGQARRS